MATEQVTQINKLCAELQERTNNRVEALIFKMEGGKPTAFLPLMPDADRLAALEVFERDTRADILETCERVAKLVTISV